MSNKGFSPDRKYSPEELQKDYRVFRGTLEAWHPSLYWYTTRDSMNYYFQCGLCGAEGFDDRTPVQKGA